jgi:hypothetical protein
MSSNIQIQGVKFLLSEITNSSNKRGILMQTGI